MTDLETRNPVPRLDNQAPELFGQTPSQTVGPFFHYGLPWKGGADLVGKSDLGARPDLFPEAHYVLNVSSPSGVPQGEMIDLRGRVIDGNGETVPDAMLEIWQANAAGRYASLADRREEILAIRISSALVEPRPTPTVDGTSAPFARAACRDRMESCRRPTSRYPCSVGAS